MEKNYAKKALIFVFVFAFALVMAGAVSATDPSDNAATNNMNQTTQPQSASQTINNKTVPDPQIWNGGVPVSRGGQLPEYNWVTIQNALNNADPGDTIMLEDGEVFSGAGNVQINIDKNINFDVLNGGTATIDGGGTNWGFNIPAGFTVTFNNITFQNFNTGTFGAAISNQGNLIITNCVFTDNSAPYSGAIGNQGECAIIDSTFTGNSATNNGGAIANDGNLTVSGSTFTDNTAGNHGGAIANIGTLEVTQSTFIDNQATNGGAISNFAADNQVGTAEIHYSRFVNNTAPNGSAIYNDQSCGVVNAEYNWWCSNEPDFKDLTCGEVDTDPYIVLTVNADPTTICNCDTSLITANLNYDNYGNPLAGTLPDGIPVTFSLVNGPYGSLQEPLTRYTVNGAASILFTANDPNAPHTQMVNATVDCQTLGADILIEPCAELEINKTSDKAKYNVCDTVTYTVDVVNNGPSNATNVVVTDTLPEGLNYVSSTNGGVWDPNTRIITWNVGNLAVNTHFIASVIATILTQGGVNLTNTAEATWEEMDEPVNTTHTIHIQEAELEINKTSDKAKYNVGDTVTYTVDLVNNGPSNATNVVVTDTLPEGLNYVSSTNGGVWDPNTRIITWNVGNLAVDAHFIASVIATVLAPGGVNLTNTAEATSEETCEPVNTTLNIYVPAAALELTKSVNNTTPFVGDTLVYTLIVHNHGPDTATSVNVTDVVLTGGLKFIGVQSINYGTYNNDTGVWTIGELPAGSTATLMLRYLVERAGTIINNAKVISETWDPNLYPSEAQVTVNAQEQPIPPVPPEPPVPPVPPSPDGKVPMQKTGAPIGTLILAVLLVFAGLLSTKRK